jgi:hypothetical protein
MWTALSFVNFVRRLLARRLSTHPRRDVGMPPLRALGARQHDSRLALACYQHACRPVSAALRDYWHGHFGPRARELLSQSVGASRAIGGTIRRW